MGLIDAVLTKTSFERNQSAEAILENIDRQLPKKLRKKLRWKKLAPLLRFFIVIFTHLAGTRSDLRQPQPASTVDRRPHNGQGERHAVASARFSDDTLRAYVERAEAYQAEIDRLGWDSANGDQQNRTRELATHMQVWTTSITSLARRIEDFRQNKLIHHDLKEVPQSIASLEVRLPREADPMMKAELERTLANRRQQLAALETLQRNIKMAEVKIESTLSMLGTIYSQILAGQSTRQVADYRRLLTEIDEEVHTLQDYLAALEEVKLARH